MNRQAVTATIAALRTFIVPLRTILIFCESKPLFRLFVLQWTHVFSTEPSRRATSYTVILDEIEGRFAINFVIALKIFIEFDLPRPIYLEYPYIGENLL